MDVDREAIRLKIRARIMALADELTDKIMHIARDVAREQLLQMVGELEVRAIAAVSDLAAPESVAPAAPQPPRPQAAEPFVVPVIPATLPVKPHSHRGMQTTPAEPGTLTANGKKLPSCKRCGFYGGNTRGCGRSHRTLPGAKPEADDSDDDEPPRDGHACSWLVVPAPDGAGASPGVPVRREPAAAVRPPQAAVAAVQAPGAAAVARTILAAEVIRRVDALENAQKIRSAPPDQDDAPGTPSAVGRRADADPSTGRWAQPGAPLRLGVDKREVCPQHGWVGNSAFLRDRHDLCEGAAVVVDDEPEPDGLEDEPAEEDADDKGEDAVEPVVLGDHRHRMRNPEVARAETIAAKRITRDILATDSHVYAKELAELDQIRPRNRTECVNGLRPCPFMGCRYHLALDVNPDTGSIKITFPDRELDELADTCALDVADRGGQTLEVVGGLINVTRERLRQLEYKAVMALKITGQADVLLGDEPPVPPDQN